MHISPALVLVFSLILSVIIGVLVTPKEYSLRSKFLWAIVSAMIGSGFSTLIYLQFSLADLEKLKDNIVKQNNLSLLESKVNEMDTDSPILETYRRYLVKTNQRLNESMNGVISLEDEDEVINEWCHLFQSTTSRHIKATNIITPEYWLKESIFSKEQLNIQRTAINNDCVVERIFIYDEKTNLNLLDSLAELNKSIGVNVRFLKFNKLQSNSIFLKHSPAIKGAEDFVICDYNITLLTISHPQKRTINYGYICDDRKVIDTAIEIFSNLWTLSEKELKR